MHRMTRLSTLLLAALLVRAAFLPVFDGLIDDGTYRITTTQKWLEDPYLIEGTSPWPVLNYLLPASVLSLGGDPFWSVRILYLFIGVSNIGMLYLVTRKLFGQTSAALAGWTLALNPFHIHCSLGGPISETPYVSFALGALWFTLRYRERPNRGDLIAIGAMVTLTAMCRLDGLLWGPICGLLLMAPQGHRLPKFNRPAAWRALISLGLLCSIYPALLALRWYGLYGDPLYFLHYAQEGTSSHFRGGSHPRFSPLVYQSYVLLFWPGSSFLILTPVIALVAALGLLRSLSRGGRIELAAPYLILCAWLMYAAFRHTILCQFRYTLILQTLLVAHLGLGLETILGWITGLSRRRLGVACVATAVATYAAIVATCYVEVPVVSRHMRNLSPLQPGAYAGGRAVAWIKAHARPDRRVIVMHQVRNSYAVLGTVGLQREGSVRFLNVWNSTLVDGQPDEEASARPRTKADLTEIFRKQLRESAYVLATTSTYEVSATDGFLPDLLDPPVQDDQPFERHGVRLIPDARFGPYRAYRVEPPAIEVGRAQGDGPPWPADRELQD